MHWTFRFFFAFFLFTAPLRSDDLPAQEIDRRINLEPSYKGQPRYALLVFGADPQSVVWIVEDSKVLYIDKNANRDLTDDGAPIPATEVSTFKSNTSEKNWSMSYVLDKWTLPNGSPVTEFRLMHWNYGDPEDKFGLSLTLEGKTPVYAGWSPIFAKTPSEVNPIDFSHPVAPRSLRADELVIGAKQGRFSIGFMTPKAPHRSTVRLSIDALPKAVNPIAKIDWPVKAGAAPVQTTHVLTERCCYWEFYTKTFLIPENVVEGKATVTISVPAVHFPLELSTDRFEIPVVNKK